MPPHDNHVLMITLLTLSHRSLSGSTRLSIAMAPQPNKWMTKAVRMVRHKHCLTPAPTLARIPASLISHLSCLPCLLLTDLLTVDEYADSVEGQPEHAWVLLGDKPPPPAAPAAPPAAPPTAVPMAVTLPPAAAAPAAAATAGRPKGKGKAAATAAAVRPSRGAASSNAHTAGPSSAGAPVQADEAEGDAGRARARAAWDRAEEAPVAPVAPQLPDLASLSALSATQLAELQVRIAQALQATV